MANAVADITLELIAVQNGTGVVLSPEILEKLQVRKGDKLYARQTPRGIELTTISPVLVAQMEVAKKVMREDRDILQKLAE